MTTLTPLKPGDCVEIIAPASRSADGRLMALKALLESWDLTCIIDDAIFGDDVLCANTDALRFRSLSSALHNPDTKAIICVRGGYGSMRLVPSLSTLPCPTEPKWFIGMSDITALHLYLGQQWHWPTVLGALSSDVFSAASIAALKALLFREINQLTFTGQPLNHAAKTDRLIQATLTGGNLCLVQTSIGTVWQLDGHHKIIFLEEIDERGYRVDRMLEHLQQAHLFNDAAAIVFGDFLGGNEANGNNLIQPVLNRFAQQCDIPVIQITGVGHGHTNFPLMLGTKATLQLGHEIQFTSFASPHTPSHHLEDVVYQ